MSSKFDSKSELDSYEYTGKKIELASGGIVFHFDPDKKKVKFLLLKHKGKDSKWDVAKGHLKKKESIEACAIREVQEETGLESYKLKLIKKLNHKNIFIKKNKLGQEKTKIVHLFLIQSYSKEIKLSKEHTDFKWVKYDKLEKKLTSPESCMNGFFEAQITISELFEL